MAFSLPKARIQGFAPEVPYNYTREGALDSLNTWERENAPTCTTITSPVDYDVGSGYNTGPYRGLILGADGKLYSPPWAATSDVLVIDPVTDTASLQSMDVSGFTFNGGNYVCGALAPNGKIYCPPYNPGTILVLDPANNTSYTSTMGASLSGTEKYTTCVLGPDGKIYCPGRTNCLIIDPATDTATTTTFGGVITTTTTIFRWGSGVRALADDKLYFAPQNVPSGSIGGHVLIIDTVTQTAKLSRFGSTPMTRGQTYGGIANNQDGLLWMLPYGATNSAYGTPQQYITYLQPIGETSADINVTQNSPYSPTARRCMGTISGSDHGVYGAPFFNVNNTYIAWYEGFEASAYGGVPAISTPGGSWWGGCLAANGKIYSLPNNGYTGTFPTPSNLRQILILRTYGSGTSVTGFRDLISTSYFNKGGT